MARNRRRSRGTVTQDVIVRSFHEAKDLAEKLESEGKSDAAIKAYVRCIVFARLEYGSEHWRYADSLVNLAKSYLDMKGYAPQAIHHAEQAKSFLLRANHVSQQSTEKAKMLDTMATMFHTLAKAYILQKKYNDSSASLLKLEHVLMDRSKLSAVTHASVVHWEYKMNFLKGSLYTAIGKFSQALSAYKRATECSRPEQLMEVKQKEGFVYLKCGDQESTKRACEAFLEAHTLACKSGEESSSVGDTALLLSRVYASLENNELAEGYLRTSLANRVQLYGEGSEQTLEVQDDLLKLYIRIGRMDEGLEIIRKTLPLKKLCFGDISAEVADVYRLLGSVQMSRGCKEKAAKSFQKSLEIQQIVLGNGHKKVKDTCRMLELLKSNHRDSPNNVLPLSSRKPFSSVTRKT